jgi:hypothetical protein
MTTSEPSARTREIVTNRIERLLYGLLAFRFVTLIPKAWLPFTLPEVWRQSVTLGVTIRYWNRWMYESGAAGKFLPAVLDAADGTGIMPMEAPILNILFAPFFALGPQYGRIAAIIAITALQFGLLLVAHRTWRLRLGWSLLLLPFLSFTFGWFGKFTPDLVSMLVTLIGVGILVEGRHLTKKNLIPSILIFVGVVVKPTNLAILALLLFEREGAEKRPLERLILLGRKYSLRIGIPVALAAAYYLVVNPWIDTFRDTPDQFHIALQGPLHTIRGILANPRGYLHVFDTRFFAPYLIYPVAILGFLAWAEGRRNKTIELARAKNWRTTLLILVIQVIYLTFISSVHVFDHEYYFMSLAPIACVIFMRVIGIYGEGIDWAKGSRFQKTAPAVLALLVLVPNFEAIWIEYRPFFNHSAEIGYLSECAELIRENPQVPFHTGASFRSTPDVFPNLGLCFGEKEMSAKAGWGFYLKDSPHPENCKVIDLKSRIELVQCI